MHIRMLLSFCELEAQAWPCSLFGLRATELRNRYDEKARDAFKALLRTDIPLEAMFIESCVVLFYQVNNRFI